MSDPGWRLPAEWERQQATLLAWPHAGTDWRNDLTTIRAEYSDLIRTLARFQPVRVLVDPADELPPAVDGDRVTAFRIPFNDTWCRDYGPIGLLRDGHRQWLDFRFDGWGGKHPAGDDDRVTAHLFESPPLNAESLHRSELELEGGTIDTDGAGRLLVNWCCLETRLPNLSRANIAAALKAELPVGHVAGVHVNALPGDDTDGHIDTLARFAAPGVVVYQATTRRDDNHTLATQLDTALRASGLQPTLHALPAPAGMEPGLPASYANFIFANGAVLVPAYGLDSDEPARALLADIQPEREVISVSARAMIRQFGALHCATMQFPASDP